MLCCGCAVITPILQVGKLRRVADCLKGCFELPVTPSHQKIPLVAFRCGHKAVRGKAREGLPMVVTVSIPHPYWPRSDTLGSSSSGTVLSLMTSKTRTGRSCGTAVFSTDRSAFSEPFWVRTGLQEHVGFGAPPTESLSWGSPLPL